MLRDFLFDTLKDKHPKEIFNDLISCYPYGSSKQSPHPIRIISSFSSHHVVFLFLKLPHVVLIVHVPSDTSSFALACYDPYKYRPRTSGRHHVHSIGGRHDMSWSHDERVR
jgi:hypothetical protein